MGTEQRNSHHHLAIPERMIVDGKNIFLYKISGGTMENVLMWSPVKEAGAGQECGLSFKGKVKVKLGDRLEAYTQESKTRKVEMVRS